MLCAHVFFPKNILRDTVSRLSKWPWLFLLPGEPALRPPNEMEASLDKRLRYLARISMILSATAEEHEALSTPKEAHCTLEDHSRRRRHGAAVASFGVGAAVVALVEVSDDLTFMRCFTSPAPGWKGVLPVGYGEGGIGG